MWACSSLLRDPINQTLIGYSKPAKIGISARYVSVTRRLNAQTRRFNYASESLSR
jgi:hypothetical protein